jgi:predicted RNA binding protein YcfA (HicA-like mRNA interferase family)
MKSREFVRLYLTPIGAKYVKRKGDHHTYELPNGARIQVPMGGGHSEAKPYLVRRLQALLERPEVKR